MSKEYDSQQEVQTYLDKYYSGVVQHIKRKEFNGRTLNCTEALNCHDCVFDTLRTCKFNVDNIDLIKEELKKKNPEVLL